MKPSLNLMIVFVAGTLLSGSAVRQAWSNTSTIPAESSCSHEHATAHHAHASDPARSGEHTAVLNLVRQCEVTDVAVQSGPWSNPRIWRGGKLPESNARVFIPKDVSVEVDTMLQGRELDWIKVEGRLAFRNDRNTALAVRTLVVTNSGALQVGSVAAPIKANVRAQILFAPRAQRDRRGDPYDLAGGLIALGSVEMVGLRKSAQAGAATRLVKGVGQLAFNEPAEGWQVGDQLLIPGTDAYHDQDEVRTVVAVGQNGRAVKLDRPLSFEHVALSGISIPIGNLTRNIELRSLAAAPLQARGHVMFMHVQTGIVIDGAAFLNLGRTDTRLAHTFPALGPDGMTRPRTDANTIGRYAVHFHVVSGARANVAPNVIRHSVVIGSPKYGIVNHGGHLLAEDNVTFQVAGSHIVAENGSEIGAFRRNMSVRSEGGGEFAIENRMSIYDFAHAGHGFWMQSGGVEVTDNWASGHAGAGIFSMSMVFRENGKQVYFDRRNAPGGEHLSSFSPIASSVVSFYIARNVVAGSGKGFEVWYHKSFTPESTEYAVLDGLTVWNVSEDAVAIPYSRHIALRNLRLQGAGVPGSAGIVGNELTEGLIVDGADIRNFAVGVRLPELGRSLVRRATLANSVNLQIGVGLHKGRRVHLENLTFEQAGGSPGTNILMTEAVFHGDMALLFEENRIDLTDRHGRNQRLFFPYQRSSAVPFPNGPPAIRGLTSGEIQRTVGFAPGGVLAPDDAILLDRSNALAAPASRPSGDGPVLITMGAGGENYPMQFRHFLPQSVSGGAAGWDVIARADAGGKPVLVNTYNNPTKFMPRRGLLPLQIHPEDVAYGYRVHGVVLDKVDGRLIVRNWEREFHDLEVGPDGFVHIAFNVLSVAGAEIPIELAVRVTPQAVQRGRNIDFYQQRAYCGACGSGTFEEDARRFYETGQIEPLVQFAGVCENVTSPRIVLKRPFAREKGRAYLSALPELEADADTSEAPHRSPLVLCESDKALSEAHSSHDAIRRFGYGRYSHWSREVYFSSSDGSDPNTNAREYYFVRRN